MKCPECGYDMQDGHLICENCGYEIRIVPDFDPSSDENIEKPEVEQVIEIAKDDENDTLEDISYHLDFSFIRNKAITVSIIVVLSLILLGIVVGAILRMNSLENQLNNVKRQAAMGKYESAISSLENIYVTHPDNSEILFLEAEYYQKLDKNDMAEDTLMRIISSHAFKEDDIYSAYDKIISIYDSAGDYSLINSLLEECEYSEVTNAYQNYMAMPPMFSVDGGEYDQTLYLKISANTVGEIYFTTDGTVPNNTSTKYESPIYLDHGDYIITAVFINQYGIVSDTVSQTYTITSDIPDEPIINADSDTYTTPILITAQITEGCSVYYTTDKSTPTEDSTPYRDPIPMPVGYSNFNFIAYNEQGLASEVVVRSYHLAFPDGLSQTAVIQKLKERLIERGLLNDMNGTSDRAPGKYTYEVISAIPIAGQGDYYTVREFYHDGTGDVSATDTTYIVEIHQGSTAILGGDAVHGFLAIAF